ncbi:MAG: hypothetical protein O6951_08935 [Actinobacteria bacterium]|nr:hypothetical protein [Actinomycetota bacterium]
MTQLTEDWGYPVVESDFDPDDPLVNTASEYMFQMATVGYHVLHGTQTVTLADRRGTRPSSGDAAPYRATKDNETSGTEGPCATDRVTGERGKT